MTGTSPGLSLGGMAPDFTLRDQFGQDVTLSSYRGHKAVALIFVELMLITAIALLFSTFSTPIMSAVFTFGFFLAGHFSTDLRNFDQVVDSPAAARLARAIYWVLPNLAQFDVKAQVVHGQPVPIGYMALTTVYALVYIGMLLAIAMYVFSRRDFK